MASVSLDRKEGVKLLINKDNVQLSVNSANSGEGNEKIKAEFNSENCKYTTLKRSKLVEFLKNRLDVNIIKYGHDIEKIEKNNNQITLTFSQNNKINCDHLIISDGVFSLL